jgi:hypothetical protein
VGKMFSNRIWMRTDGGISKTHIQNSGVFYLVNSDRVAVSTSAINISILIFWFGALSSIKSIFVANNVFLFHCCPCHLAFSLNDIQRNTVKMV